MPFCHHLRQLLLAALLSGLALLPLAAAARTEGAQVREVIDGDTVILADERHVRLIGINAPELGHPCHPGKREPGLAPAGRDCRPTSDEPLAVAARDRLRELVQGRTLRVVFEQENRDRYGRWLAHLLVDGSHVEETLLREGLASAIAIPPNVGELARHQAAETEARRARRGIWGNTYSSPVSIESLASGQTGYRFVRGRVTHVGKSKKYVYLDMGPRFALRIAHADWAQYFRGQPGDWLGRTLVARGWISEHDGRLHMAIGHPAMLE